MTQRMKVGYIGLGIMGKAMARNILKAGFQVVVHNRSRQAVNELVAEGAIEAFSPKEVAQQVDVVFTNLPDSPDVERVAMGDEGVLHGAAEGMIFVDNSTIKPATARKIADHLAQKGVLCLDAPVSGGDIGAQQGTLAIMVGGPSEALEKVMPIFDVIGKKIGDLKMREKFGLVLLGSKVNTGEIKFNPSPEKIVEEGMILIVMGDVTDIAKVRDLY